MTVEEKKYSNEPERPFVSICCITYNHAPYIRQALESFLVQRTTFPFEIIVNDDASTDGTTGIIMDYREQHPELIFPVLHEENEYSKGRRAIMARNTFPRARGKYIAICEGDDYWHDPFKLQKQVDFLESNPGYGMVYTDVARLNEHDGSIEENILKGKWGDTENNFESFLVTARFLAPCTWVFRKDIFPIIRHHLGEDNPVGDLPLLLSLSKVAKVGFLDDSTATYRALAKSASHLAGRKQLWKFRKGIFNIQKKFGDYYKVAPAVMACIKDKYYAEYFTSIMLFDDKQSRKEAYAYLEKRRLLAPRFRMLFFFTLAGPVRDLLVSYDRLKQA